MPALSRGRDGRLPLTCELAIILQQMSPLIETDHLTKRFRTLTAVKDVHLSVGAGEILALLGPNGAGKTTTIRMLSSILKPTSGRAVIAGYDTVEDAAQVRAILGLLTEHHGLYTRMKADDYLTFFGRIYGMPPDLLEERIRTLLAQYDLDDAADMRLGHYSKGMRQKLALVRALLHDPSVLLLDEPTSAMDPYSAHMVRESIAGLRRANRAIIVCTHNLHEAELLADQIAIIRKGSIIVRGSPAELKRTLLGDPVMEVQLAQHIDGVDGLIPAGAALIELGDTWLRYSTPDPRGANPRIIRSLQAQGYDVVTLTEVERSLEDVYLQAVGAQEKVGEPV